MVKIKSNNNKSKKNNLNEDIIKENGKNKIK